MEASRYHGRSLRPKQSPRSAPEMRDRRPATSASAAAGPGDGLGLARVGQLRRTLQGQRLRGFFRANFAHDARAEAHRIARGVHKVVQAASREQHLRCTNSTPLTQLKAADGSFSAGAALVSAVENEVVASILDRASS